MSSPAASPAFTSAGAPGFAPAALIALPFLSPFVAGPSANVWQLLVTWACATALWAIGPRARPSLGVLALLAVLGAAIALGHGADLSQSLGACTALAMAGIAASVGAAWARAPGEAVAPLALGLFAAGVVSAVLGLFQYYGAAAWLAPFTTAPDVGQAYGNLRQRNQFATLVSMALVAGLWLHAGWGRGARLGLWGGVALLTLAAAASTSRTGLLQWLAVSALGGGLAWAERRGRPGGPHRLPHPLLLLGLIPAYFIAAGLLPLLAGPEVEDMLRRLREGAPEGHSRLLLWHNVMDLIRERPWGGWGWGELSYAHFMHLYGGPRFVEILDNAHNLPLHLAVELGLPAALAVCGGFAALVLAARPWRERDPARLMAWGVLGAMVLHSLLEYPLWYGPFQLVFGLCLGLLWPGADARVRQGHRRAVSAVTALLVAVTAYAGWDYLRISQIYLPRAERLPPWRDDTMAKLKASWLFAEQVRFAELSLTPVVRATAPEVHALGQRVLHFSPEPKVVAKLVESATLLGRDDEALALAARFKIAYPVEYARWIRGEAPDAPAD
ncbi:PglL family O-oligosaccharyltransferase [Variovorax sp. ZT4R33]|uniref:PglL family O-oligosaccharyltransferase n=1 Tax=Variovorax sp. ZT4R33 TaxID=3443743 RepID=UPI003F44EF19